jgi:serine/threonine protein kinase
MSPELLKRSEKKINPYKSDVYSLGLVLLCVCSFKKITREFRSQYMHDDSLLQGVLFQMIEDIEIVGSSQYQRTHIKEFIKKCLRSNPLFRPDFKDLSREWYNVRVLVREDVRRSMK